MNIEELRSREYREGDAVFFFDPINVMQALPIAEKIRHEMTNLKALEETVGQMRDGMNDDEEARTFVALVRSILSVKPEFVDSLRKDLFAHIRYRNKSARTPQRLLGSEEQAFHSLGLMTVYRVLIQAVVANFYDFFQDLLSGFGRMMEETETSEESSQPSPQTSIPGLQPQ